MSYEINNYEITKEVAGEYKKRKLSHRNYKIERCGKVLLKKINLKLIRSQVTNQIEFTKSSITWFELCDQKIKWILYNQTKQNHFPRNFLHISFLSSIKSFPNNSSSNSFVKLSPPSHNAMLNWTMAALSFGFLVFSN